MTTGTRVRFDGRILTLGAAVPIYAVGDPDTPDGSVSSGAIPADESPTVGVLEAAYISSTPGVGMIAKLRLLAPGPPNNGRRVTLSAAAVHDAIDGEHCPDHWHCDPSLAAHVCDQPDRTKPCPTCLARGQ